MTPIPVGEVVKAIAPHCSPLMLRGMAASLLFGYGLNTVGSNEHLLLHAVIDYTLEGALAVSGLCTLLGMLMPNIGAKRQPEPVDIPNSPRITQL